MKKGCRLGFVLPWIPFVLLAFLVRGSYAQSTTVSGKVTDAASGDPIPYANIVFKGTSIGVTSDFDGHYELATIIPTDSLVASYIGYHPRSKPVIKGSVQAINFQLEEQVTQLGEVVIHAGENPAFAILRNVVEHKSRNDRRSLLAYQYDTYSKIEIDVDNISEEFRKKKIIRKVTQVLDSVDVIAGEDGKPVLPLFISESVSKYYRRLNPEMSYEDILRSRIRGVGVEDGTLIAQLTGATFQEYNFYQNWLNIVGKDFVSPIADGWRLYYDYDLVDSLFVGDRFCYRLDFFPKSEQDLAFTGTMWISRDEYALKQIEMTVGKKANLNFVEKIKIQQELEPTNAGAWIPVKNRILVDIGEVNDKWAGVLAKFYTSNRNVVVNQPREAKFYQKGITLQEDFSMHQEDAYWDSLRHDPLSETEKSVYRMIDTLTSIPVVRTYVDLIKIFINGYVHAGKIDVGPYFSFLAVNNIEGLRIQGGFRTNIKFSDQWVLGAQLGYGFNDERVKYLGYLENILDRKRWTTMSLLVRSDLARLGLDDPGLADDYFYLAAAKYGYIRKGFYFDEAKFSFQRELVKGYSQRLAFRYATFRPTFNFGYYGNPTDTSSVITSGFESAEAIVESHFSLDEDFVQNDNDRISLGPTRSPIITMRYTRGIKGVAGSDFEYDKLWMSIEKRIKLGLFGTGYATLTGEYVFNTLPYPLLAFHLGNQTFFYTSVTSNLMDYGEFVSDHFASLRYVQHFEGFLLNRIPLIRHLKWRLTGSANIIYGGLRQANQDLNAEFDEATNETQPIGHFTRDPYVELGYGVENIFKVFRVEFVHRLTYLDQPDVRRFGVLFAIQWTL